MARRAKIHFLGGSSRASKFHQTCRKRNLTIVSSGFYNIDLAEYNNARELLPWGVEEYSWKLRRRKIEEEKKRERKREREELEMCWFVYISIHAARGIKEEERAAGETPNSKNWLAGWLLSPESSSQLVSSSSCYHPAVSLINCLLFRALITLPPCPRYSGVFTFRGLRIWLDRKCNNRTVQPVVKF